MKIDQEDRDALRRYLFGELPEAGEEQIELRLLADDDYFEELEAVENELIDEYAHGGLTPEQRQRLEGKFLRAPERQRKVAFAAALNEAAQAHSDSVTDGAKIIPLTSRPSRPPRNLISSPYFRIAALLIVTVGGGYGLWALLADRSDVSRGLLALNDAYKHQRLVETRVSGLPYAPVERLRGDARPNVDHVARDLAERYLLEAVRTKPDADSRHALARLYLAGQRFAEAREQLDQALAAERNNARLHSDAGAALLELGNAAPADESGKRIEYFAEALTHLDRALELDGSLLEARFNRALLYQHMGVSQARAEWRGYLERDPQSRWAEEARQRLKALEEQPGVSWNEEQSLRDFQEAYERSDEAGAWEIVRRNYTSAGNTVTNALLDAYLDLDTKGETAAADVKFRQLTYLGRLEGQRAGDAYTSDLARFYSRAHPAQRRALARARAQMRRGYELFLKSQLEEAEGLHVQAMLVFAAAGNVPETLFAEYRLGHSYLLRAEIEKSGAIFERLIPACESKDYRWLLSQSLHRAATVRLGSNKYSESIHYARRSLKLSEQGQDVIGVLKNLILLGDEYQSLGDESRSLGFFQRALTLSADIPAEPSQTWGVFTGIGLNLNSLGFDHAASEYQKEALRLALELDRPLFVSRSHDYLGLTYASLGRYEEALSHVAKSFDAARGLSGQPSGMEMLANASLHAGDIYRRAGDHAQAVISYDRSIGLYDEFGLPYFNYAARKGKLLSHLAHGDEVAAEGELRAIMELFEQYRSKLTGEGQRNSFFDAEQGVYDLAMDFTLSRKGDARRAFEYSEMSRARSLLDVMRRGAVVAERGDGPELTLNASFAPRASAEVQRLMPPAAQMLQYAMLEEKLLVWVITRENVEVREVPVTSRDLSKKVSAYLREVGHTPADGGDNAVARRHAQELYDLLIRPVEGLLDKGKVIYIAPDKALHFLPYGALVTPAGKYLLEDFRLGLSPSANVFVDCSERARSMEVSAEAAGERLLSVGDPGFDRQAFPSLTLLPSAAREARQIAAYYGSPRLLLGAEAREAAVVPALREADVAHFALHYVADDRSGMLSGMVLAGGGEVRGAASDGLWQIHEIFGAQLPRTRLVILSACQTGVENQYRGEGAVSAARPFIAAGVPVVVASLWPVDSDSTAHLMIRFHELRTRRRQPTAEALRLAQLEMLGGDDPRYRHPFYWAAFAAIGGHTDF